MASAVIQWLAGLFDDVTTRIRPGITWTATSAAAPLDVQVRPADRPAMSLHLGGDGPNDLRSFATALQQELNPLLGTEAPPCPTHGVALEAVETDKRLSWRCKEGDFTCAVGEYRESLWPPGPEEPQENLGSWLGHRLRRRGLMHGVAQWSVSRRDGALVGYMALRPSADESAIRGAAAPVVLDVTHIGAVATVREVEPAGDGDPARRTLRLSGEMPAMRLARLQGILRRPRAEDDCDFIVEAGRRRVRVHLQPEHRCGGPGEPVVLDHAGAPFADDGDEVACGGGFGPGSQVEGEPGVFSAGKLTVCERDSK